MSRAADYRIEVRGRLDEDWSDWFDGMTLTSEGDDSQITTLTGPVDDQARLRGILSRLWDLNLTVVSITRISPEERTNSR
jgi:hypothetical protein